MSPTEITRNITLNRGELPHLFLVVVCLLLCGSFLPSNVESLQIMYLLKFRKIVKKAKKRKDSMALFLKEISLNRGPNVFQLKFLERG